MTVGRFTDHAPHLVQRRFWLGATLQRFSMIRRCGQPYGMGPTMLPLSSLCCVAPQFSLAAW